LATIEFADAMMTQRLSLQPFAPEMADALLAIFRDPGVRRFLLDDELVSPEWVVAEIESSRERFDRDGSGLWGLNPTETGELIGFVGFREFFEPPQLQLLFGLLPNFWGRGLATEAADRVCRHAFLDLGFSEIKAAIDLPNQASRRVLERLGMKQIGMTDHGVGGTCFFTLSREDWSKGPAP
jgi:ribosomal-protein-alanine N-acetyltransferase